MKRKWTVIFFGMLIALIISACNSSQMQSPSPSPGETVEPTAPDIPEVNVSASDTDELKQAVAEGLSAFYSDEEVSSITIVNSKIEVTILADFSVDDEPPAEWDSICENAQNASNSLQEIAAEYDFDNGALYLRNESENILLTVLKGRILFSAYETYEYSGNNPPTISLEEFNAIRTGMTYQEVYDIIGSQGQVLSEVDLGMGDEYYTVVRQWDGEGSLGANANITFQGGKVTAKAQFGLE